MTEGMDQRQWVWGVRLELLTHVAADPILLSELGHAIGKSIKRIEMEGSGDSTQDAGWRRAFALRAAIIVRRLAQTSGL